MSLPATDNFTGVDGTTINGRTTTTGSLTWAGSGWEVNSNRAYSPGGGTVLLNSGASDIVASFKPIAFSFNILVFRSNSGGTTKLEVWVESNRIRIFDDASVQVGTTYTGTVTSGDTISVEASGTSIVVKQNGTARITTTSSHGQTNTYVGFRGAGSEINDDFSVDAYAVSSPTATLTKGTATAVYLTGTAGSGGTSPQWSRSTAADGTFSNLSDGSGVSGATTNSLVDGSSGIAAGTRYYYKVTYATSGASNIATAAKWKQPAYLLGIGDSVMLGFGTTTPSSGGTSLGTTSPLYHMSLALKRAGGGERDVIVYDASESGTKASDWYDSSAGSPVQTRLSTAKTNGLSAGGTDAMVVLGINNAYSVETVSKFALDLAGIASYLLANGYGRVVLCYPTGIPATETSAETKLRQIAAAIDALCNGTTILLGDTLMLNYLPDHCTTELQTGGTSVHPNDTGARSAGEAWAHAWQKAVGDEPAGGGVSGSRIFGGF